MVRAIAARAHREELANAVACWTVCSSGGSDVTPWWGQRVFNGIRQTSRQATVYTAE
ncbi:MAG TPA: hypothetical protein VL738_14290 [Dactylosporangium sp.]|jgi:hypothetical protein|nr:hypothetical protein [Dactylosporangium sp.]